MEANFTIGTVAVFSQQQEPKCGPVNSACHEDFAAGGDLKSVAAR